MPSPNVEAARRANAAFRRGDMAAMLREVDPDRESGIALEENWAHLYTIREGRVARFHAFRSRDEALEALAYPHQS
jgi:ketosteroid isomerase-like protein